MIWCAACGGELTELKPGMHVWLCPCKALMLRVGSGDVWDWRFGLNLHQAIRFGLGAGAMAYFRVVADQESFPSEAEVEELADMVRVGLVLHS